MRVTIPVPINPLNTISSTASTIHAPATHSLSTTYGYGAIVQVAADFKIYESIIAVNVGHEPGVSPLWWRIVGVTETPYSNATTYALGATCSANQRCYESLTAGNLNKPLPVLPEKLTVDWQDVGPTNQAACFDMATNTKTVTAGPLTLVIKPGIRVNTLGLTGLSANTLVVTGRSLGAVVYGPLTKDLNTRRVADGYDYAFTPFTTQPSQVFFDLPPYTDLELTITLTATSGNVKCGGVVVGTYTYLGEVQYGAVNDPLNFSTITRDDWGKAVLVPRPSVPKTTQTLHLPSANVNKVMVARDQLNAVPGLYTGLDDGDSDFFDMLARVGVYKTFRIEATSYGYATIQLDVEEI